MQNAPEAPGTVEIATTGRGGSITYVEQGRRIAFSWEFAMSPSIALVFGPSEAALERDAPWAAGRRAEIYAAVGRGVVQQQVPGGGFVVDLASNMIDILQARPR
jgi:hypothetical protein